MVHSRNSTEGCLPGRTQLQPFPLSWPVMWRQHQPIRVAAERSTWADASEGIGHLERTTHLKVTCPRMRAL